jgi:CheY-like chemotaxis protein
MTGSRLARGAARTPAVAIIDLKVPIIDGWSLAEALRCMLGKTITLVALTSRDEPDERERSGGRGIR